ncbi:MAG: cytochrome c [Steroidobacteraceae bacterium]
MNKITGYSLLIGLSGLTQTAHAADFAAYSGEQLFQRLCASCHGSGAQGNGPVAASLNVAVPNLRELTKRNRGTFPMEKIEKIVDGRISLAPHGTRIMPVWGDELLRSEAGDPEAERATANLIHKIVEYLRDIQGVPPEQDSTGK